MIETAISRMRQVHQPGTDTTKKPDDLTHLLTISGIKPAVGQPQECQLILGHVQYACRFGGLPLSQRPQLIRAVVRAAVFTRGEIHEVNHPPSQPVVGDHTATAQHLVIGVWSNNHDDSRHTFTPSARLVVLCRPSATRSKDPPRIPRAHDMPVPATEGGWKRDSATQWRTLGARHGEFRRARTVLVTLR